MGVVEAKGGWCGRRIVWVRELSAVLLGPVSRGDNHSFGEAYVAQVSTFSAVVAPLIGCDVALTAFSKTERLFRLSVPKNSLTLAVGDVFI